ncbi:biotin--[acetyl-CoA-carboxylase] ligase [Bacteroides sp. 519]|uniref:biotin--[acetyl-CoA-carboxylase] ligase n=1 Tax=Bacteroides sp. 519 TaxID=2302937 RepID=UPI0013D536EB|nr:biotin--[acetyl-CoA-carboxylase] ligase [Bacteroides sp. 519]NDV58914.1 biotin--[acetyl-CoA-carboxylase] ligase [Bacteroides sp. 519]
MTPHTYQEYVDETNSTNNYLQELLKKGPLPAFSSVIAGFQTAGKGQRGNHWISEKDKNLLCSIYVKPDFLEVSKQFYLSKIAALAIRHSLNMFVDGITIKWPNDIYWKNKKICGILIENDIQGAEIKQSIIGVGLNINQESFDSSLPNPVSLFNITNHVFGIKDMLKDVIEHLQYYYDILKQRRNEIDETYYSMLYRNDGYYPYRDAEGTFSARIVEVLPEGFLVLEDEQGKRRQYAFKEVEYLI